MKFSYNWISELVDGLDVAAADLSNLITLKTAESEGVEKYGAALASVVAARVESAEPIEGSKNVKAAIDAGRLGKKTVVCGAPNCRAGIVTAYVPVGVTLGDGREIRKAVIAGVESEGMLASGAELGLNRDGAGILELQISAGELLGVAVDHIIEIDNKSLTHRPDLWGHHGMAREVSAILRKPLRDPVDLSILPEGAGAIPVSIENFELCPRYSALVIENVTVQPSPLWLQYRLEAIGLNPINNVVDVTNWIMAEIAQPMHAFDADKLHGSIRVRSAVAGEKMGALNGETYELTPSNLVIADDSGAIALAGVIGGAASAISDGTKRIILESANFHAGSVRKTSSSLKLRTDASMRFEKSQDPANTVRGLARAIELLRIVSPGVRVVHGIADVAGPVRQTDPIRLPIGWLNRKLGKELPIIEVRRILEALQFGVGQGSEDVLSITVPTWRATKDISLREDLVEEVGRMIGYSSITPTSPLLPAAVPPTNEERQYLQGLRTLVAAQGFHEVYNYSFLSEETVQHFGFDPELHVKVLNPIATDQGLMRTSLVPGIWKNLVDNSRFSDEFRLFEVGREVHKRSGDLPLEVNHICAAVYFKEPGAQGLFELKRLGECIVPGLELRPAPALLYEHPTRTAEAVYRGEVVGRLFEFHPSMVKGRGSVLDLNIDALMRLCPTETCYTSIRRFPTSAFDLSVIVPERALVGDIQRRLKEFGSETLQTIEYVRQYSGAPLAEGTKSVSYRLTVGAADRTLSSEELGEARTRVIDGMRELGFDLRV
ncbi:MAG TPA: phenylalanine--tRNA ligase subunit beta [Bryobacteraceae bacterium]|nr:phenylalanine--tRNA ligase subunit beta [Bryobacteraceae bacterium]